MSVYSISSIEVKDWNAYKEYMKLVPSVIKKYGGKYLVRGGDIITDNTSWNPKRIVILEFPTLEDLNAFRNSEEYKPVADIRLKASTSESFVVEGI
ncbi:MAG: DUF1330 domain-containing protein [Chloroflexota bacterium]|jgi:uncharacterized protein (DUF1330 family)|nr:DUF1330 domain-containing protein [Chloroflexota bacterium]